MIGRLRKHASRGHQWSKWMRRCGDLVNEAQERSEVSDVGRGYEISNCSDFVGVGADAFRKQHETTEFEQGFGKNEFIGVKCDAVPTPRKNGVDAGMW